MQKRKVMAREMRYFYGIQNFNLKNLSPENPHLYEEA